MNLCCVGGAQGALAGGMDEDEDLFDDAVFDQIDTLVRQHEEKQLAQVRQDPGVRPAWLGGGGDGGPMAWAHCNQQGPL